MQIKSNILSAARDAGHIFATTFRNSVLPAVVVAGLGFSGSLNAKPMLTPKQREQIQELRIQAAAKAGKLTPSEVATLQVGHDAIAAEIKADKEGGQKLTLAERAQLEAQLSALSKLIYTNAHPSAS